jgi:hypothetical protein
VICEVRQKGGAAVTLDESLHRFRLRAFALARELGNARAACRALGIHPSTSYRWRKQLLRFGPEDLRPRERRRPRMPNALSPLVEQRVVAFALGHPGSGPARSAAELARPLWGGLRVSPSGVWRALKRHGLTTRAKRLGLVAGAAVPPEPAGAGAQVHRPAAGPRPLRAVLNTDRAHTGRWTQGRTPEEVLGKAAVWSH